MTPQLDELTSRRARIRAIAAGLVDSPRMARRFHVPAGVPLQPSPRRRNSGRQPRPRDAGKRRSPVLRRVVAGGFLIAQASLLAALFIAPGFRVHTIEVSGEHLLERGAVLTAAAVPQSSLFAVDSDGIRARLSQLPWVRSVSVATKLPATVQIDVTEWQPDVVVRQGGVSAFVAPNGAMLAVGPDDVAQMKALPLLLDDRGGDRQQLPAGLPDLMAAIAQRWPAVFGGGVEAFQWSRGGVLSIWSSTGWQAIVGNVDSSAALAGIPQQFAALAALRGRVDFISPSYGYIDLENAAEPAIGGRPGVPAALKAEIAAAATPASLTAPAAAVGAAASGTSPAPSTPSSPTPKPAPTPTPKPTPFVFTLPTPAPTRGA